MKKIVIYEFQANTIHDALRNAARVLNSDLKATCMDRDIMQALQFIENAIAGKIDQHVSRL